jgi:hypothetical protein
MLDLENNYNDINYISLTEIENVELTLVIFIGLKCIAQSFKKLGRHDRIRTMILLEVNVKLMTLLAFNFIIYNFVPVLCLLYESVCFFCDVHKSLFRIGT